MLAGVLRSSGIAGQPEEYFWRGDVPHWRERWAVQTDSEYLTATLEAGTTPNGVFGARVMWAYLGDVAALISRATGATGEPSAVILSSFRDFRVVLLRRRDRVAQAVSWAKAEQTGVWYEGDVRGQRHGSFDADLIDRLLASVEEAEQGWSSFVNETGVDAFEMTYEELAADPIAAGRSVLRFLGLPTRDIELQVQTRRQFDETNSEWIARFRAERR